MEELDVANKNAFSLPEAGDLITADSAVNHARRIHAAAAAKLSSAFDDLRNARGEIDVVKEGIRRSPRRAEAKLTIFGAGIRGAAEKLQ